ncbi:MAG: hypothetical protein QME79_10260 [Bacillota bacterium]|nr:hypothetical protein [Bacillota bacterium]
MAVAITGSPKISPHWANPLFEVRMIEPSPARRTETRLSVPAGLPGKEGRGPFWNLALLTQDPVLPSQTVKLFPFRGGQASALSGVDLSLSGPVAQ